MRMKGAHMRMKGADSHEDAAERNPHKKVVDLPDFVDHQRCLTKRPSKLSIPVRGMAIRAGLVDFVDRLLEPFIGIIL